jgi:hypothetical protein
MLYLGILPEAPLAKTRQVASTLKIKSAISSPETKTAELHKPAEAH